jgi:hypothetical protein
MRQRYYRGRRVRDVPLPGDEQGVLDNMIRTAIRRDEWLNSEELTIALCTRQRLMYGVCLQLECPYCDDEYMGGYR